jgi:hypothetical protein
MTFLRKRKDDFAEIAASPERRRAAIVDLGRSSRRLSVAALFFTVVTVMLVWERNVGAACTGLLAAMFIAVGARMESDRPLLQVLDNEKREHETTSA